MPFPDTGRDYSTPEESPANMVRRDLARPHYRYRQLRIRFGAHAVNISVTEDQLLAHTYRPISELLYNVDVPTGRWIDGACPEFERALDIAEHLVAGRPGSGGSESPGHV